MNNLLFEMRGEDCMY